MLLYRRRKVSERLSDLQCVTQPACTGSRFNYQTCALGPVHLANCLIWLKHNAGETRTICWISIWLICLIKRILLQIYYQCVPLAIQGTRWKCLHDLLCKNLSLVIHTSCWTQVQWCSLFSHRGWINILVKILSLHSYEGCLLEHSNSYLSFFIIIITYLSLT